MHVVITTEVRLHLLAEWANVQRNGTDGGDHHEDVDDDVEDGIFREGKQNIIADVSSIVDE